MKRILILFAAVMLTFSALAGGTTYSRVKIHLTGHNGLALLQSGIEIQWLDKSGEWAVAELSQEELSKVSQLGFSFEVMIPDVEAYYADRYLHPENYESSEPDAALAETWPVPANFQLGTCGGFSTIDQMIEQLDLMHELYPNLITVKHPASDTITSINGQEIYYVKISDNPETSESEPQILYTGMHHAREPIGMQHLLYYMWYLLENYESNSLVRALVDTTEMYFIPVINVDGYAFNIANSPNGGGMWRKNRRLNQNGSYGIDINRNYGYMWGYDNSGSSPNPDDDTFRGTAPFSEPETRIMKHFCEDHDFRIALNYHSYSNLFLYSWGYSDEPSPDELLFNSFSKLLTVENGFTYGPASTTIYPTNGGSDDWMYGEQTTKGKILSWTPEVGGDADGFWPLQSRIVPLCQINMLQSLLSAQLVGKYAIAKDLSPMVISSPEGYFKFNITRFGLQDGSYTVTITPLNGSIASVGEPKQYAAMQVLQSVNDSIAYTLDPLIMSGDTLKYALTVDNGYYQLTDTLVKYFGMPVTIVNDSLNTIEGWTGTWALTSLKYFSPTKSMTDSPSGNYANNANKSTTTTTAVSLKNAMFAMLEFEAQWGLEAGYDYVQVKISTNQGLSWTPLAGQYTHAGNSNQAAGQPLYDGLQSNWVKETILLNDYLGKDVLFRFMLRSDAGEVADGFYFDDFKVSILLDPTKAENHPNNTFNLLGIPYPNPANGSLTIPFNLPAASQSFIKIYSSQGKMIKTIPVNNSGDGLKLDVSNWPEGMYLIKLESDNYPVEVRKVMIR
jgi:hypothetical protein